MTRPEEDLVEELAPGDRLSPDQRDPEAPPADAAEQAATVTPAEGVSELRRSLEVDEYDAFEQSLVVNLDDEYDR